MLGNRAPRDSAAKLRLAKDQHGTVRWHVDDLGKLKAVSQRCSFEISTVADTPLFILLAEMSIEGRIARRRVDAIARKGAIDDQQAVLFQIPRSATHQSLRNWPWADMQYIDGENRLDALAWRPSTLIEPPIRCLVEIDRRSDIRQITLCPPCFDAGAMQRIGIGRPSGKVRQSSGEGDHMLTCAATNLDDVFGPAAKQAEKHVRDDGMISMERRGIKASVSQGLLVSVVELTNSGYRGSNSCATPNIAE